MKPKFTLLFMVLLLVSANIFGQGCSSCISISPTTFEGCPGHSLYISPTITGSYVTYPTTFSWTGPVSCSPSNTQGTTVTVPFTAQVDTLTVVTECNKSIDGSFPDSNTTTGNDFTTAYSLGNGSMEGHIVVSNNAWDLVSSGCPTFGDHSTPSDYMLLVNGNKTNVGGPFWSQCVNVCPDSTYTFTYWARSMGQNYPGQQPLVQVEFRGTDGCGGGNVSDTVCPTIPIDPVGWCGGWYQYSLTWNSGSATSCQISMSDLCTSAAGNDFAIDDIMFTANFTSHTWITIEPPATVSETVTPASSPVCVNSYGSFYLVPDGTSYVYYTLITPTGSSQAGSNSYATIPVTSSVAGTVTLRIDSITDGATGCTFPYVDSASITFLALPTITPGTIAPICAWTTSASFPYTVTGSTPVSYELSWIGTPPGPDVYPWTTLSSNPLPLTFYNYLAAGTYSGVLTLKSAAGCTASYTITVTVDPYPGPITGPSSVCVGSTITLSDDSTGGTWTSLTTSTASVNNSSGVVTGGPNSGTAIIEYGAAGCDSTKTITVNPLPTLSFTVTSVCQGTSPAQMNYTSTGSPNKYSITWGTAAIDSGFTNVGTTTLLGSPINITVPPGAGAGTYTGSITITNTTTTCGKTYSFTLIIKPLPVITGPSQVCKWQQITLTGTPSGGTWSSTADAIISSGGVLTGTTAGQDIVTYTGTNSCSAHDTVTVLALPYPGVITDSANDSLHLCLGDTAHLSESVLGGLWGSANTGIVLPIDTIGDMYGAGVGATNISYIVTDSNGCRDTANAFATVDTNGIPHITGILGVCAGGHDTLYNSLPGGLWTCNPTSVAIINPYTGVITGYVSGMATVKYTVTNSCGVYVDSVTIVVNMPPYITTHLTIGCQTLADSTDPGTNSTTSILTDTSGCVKVCDSSVVRYYANGVNGSVFTWAIQGGTILNNYGDSVDVLWPAAGIISSITVFDTASPCTSQRTICIEVIQKPHAAFAILPGMTPAVGPINICPGANINFYDLSTGDPQSAIVSTMWNFGDGNGSSEQNPSHTFNTSGYDTVSLVVKNACNCTDTYRVVINVASTSGSQFLCSSAVCVGDTVTYGFSDSCGASTGYNYSVSGGTLVGGMNPIKATVAWNQVDTTTGFGYVSGVDPCSTCPDTVTLKVPVIIPNAAIQGPDTICAGQQYEYTLPLWPATEYHWGMLDEPGSIIGANNDYKVVVGLDTEGSYTLHGWYKNDITLCGGNVFKTIYVQPAVAVTGNLTVCNNTTQTYIINGGDGGDYNWQLADPTGAIAESGSGSGDSLAVAFSFDPSVLPGLYVLTVSGAFCANPITINVQSLPPAIDSISGPDTVCLNRVYTYVAHTDVPGTIYNWQITGGTITPASGSGTVTVIWTGGSSMELTVDHTNVLSPFCEGHPFSIDITQELIDPYITGDTLPCSNAYRTYTCNYTRGETYDWSIAPNTAGSIVSGNHTPTVQVMFNNVTTAQPVTLSLIVHKCDSTFTDSLQVMQEPALGATVTASPNPACPLQTISFTATPGGISYLWIFGDGNTVTTTSNTTTHVYPANPATGNVNYTVKVIVSPNPADLCPVSGYALVNVAVLPGPVAVASCSDPFLITTPAILAATVTNNVSGLTFQWYNNSGLIVGATDSTLATDTSGRFYFIVTAGNGCSATSNTYPVDTPGVPNIHDCGGTPDASASTYGCGEGQILLQGYGTGTPQYWTVDAPPIGGLDSISLYEAIATYDVPAIYSFTFSMEFGDTCATYKTIYDTLGVIRDFTYALGCGTGGMDTVKLFDHTQYLPFWTIDSIKWYLIVEAMDTEYYIGTGPNVDTVLPAPGYYSFSNWVYLTGPDGPEICEYERSFEVPAQPSAVAFTDSLSPICEGVAIYFNPVSTTNIVDYNWSFGDGTSSLLQSPQRTYTWENQGLGATTPNSDTVIFKITDNTGCQVSDTGVVQIYPNVLSGFLGPNQIVCSNEAPILLTYTNQLGSPAITQYSWSNGSAINPTPVSQSGAYWVTVYDTHQCQVTLPEPTLKVDIIRTPAAAITGATNYCIGDVVNLSGYAGTGVVYQWYRNGTGIGGNTPSISDPGLSVGDYGYQLVLTVTDTSTGQQCFDTSTIYTIHMYGQPDPPTITGPTVVDCNLYHLQLLATEPVSGTYNWSNGIYGATDDIYTGGPYRVWFTNQYGCIAHSDILVPMPPEYYFPYFPSGCYAICPAQLPLTLYGPPSVYFANWAWLMNGTDVEDGSGSAMASYTITDAGTYGWDLSNGLCEQQSDSMNLSFDPSCGTCVKNAVRAIATCTSGNPASYQIVVQLVTGDDNTSYTLGTDDGPVLPFSGTLAIAGTHNLTLTFTTLTLPPPDSITVEVYFTFEGHKCFLEKRIALPTCDWTDAEKPAPAPPKPTDSTQNQDVVNPAIQQIPVQTALLVYPNPASGDVTLSYDYGNSVYKERMLGIYDALGQRMSYTIATTNRGTWQLSTDNWAPGVYMIRMEADGITLQTQRLSVDH